MLNSKIENVSVIQLNASDMSLPSGVTLYKTNKIVVCGKMVTVDVSVKMQGLSSQQYSIGNYIPANYRPKENVSFCCDNGLGDGKVQAATITQGGIMNFYPISTGTTYAIGSATYIRE